MVEVSGDVLTRVPLRIDRQVVQQLFPPRTSRDQRVAVRLYRVTKSNPPTEEDMMSYWDLGKRPARQGR